MEYDDSSSFITSQDEDQNLWLLLTYARDAVFRAREMELQKWGITPEQARLMLIVQALENQATPATISRYLLRKRHTTVTLVERAAKKGLVRKYNDLERKNLVRVAMTEKGQKAYELSTTRGPIHRIMGVLNEREKEELRKHLEKIYSQARKEIGLDVSSLPSSDL